MDLKEYIKSLIRTELEEQSSSAGAGGYMTPNAFSPKGQKTNAATKAAEKQGFKKVSGMPKNSKVLDYKELWKGKKSAANESNYDAASKYGAPSGYTAASGYTGASLSSKGDGYYKKGTTNEMKLKDIIQKELINEVTYSKFKNEVKFRTKNEQLHKAIREVKRKLSEIDRIVEYTSRMKQELQENEEGVKYWKATQKNVATISEMVTQLNNKVKELY